jgi:hypothetical protein
MEPAMPPCAKKISYVLRSRNTWLKPAITEAMVSFVAPLQGEGRKAGVVAFGGAVAYQSPGQGVHYQDAPGRGQHHGSPSKMLDGKASSRLRSQGAEVAEEQSQSRQHSEAACGKPVGGNFRSTSQPTAVEPPTIARPAQATMLIDK